MIDKPFFVKSEKHNGNSSASINYFMIVSEEEHPEDDDSTLWGHQLNTLPYFIRVYKEYSDGCFGFRKKQDRKEYQIVKDKKLIKQLKAKMEEIHNIAIMEAL